MSCSFGCSKNQNQNNELSGHISCFFSFPLVNNGRQLVSFRIHFLSVQQTFSVVISPSLELHLSHLPLHMIILLLCPHGQVLVLLHPVLVSLWLYTWFRAIKCLYESHPSKRELCWHLDSKEDCLIVRLASFFWNISWSLVIVVLTLVNPQNHMRTKRSFEQLYTLQIHSCAYEPAVMMVSFNLKPGAKEYIKLLYITICCRSH